MNLTSGSARRAFTLIELLVVIAIIAILAAILFPVFAQARESARKTTCTSNLKQVGTAFMMYVQDYDEFYPAHNGVTQVAATKPDGTTYTGHIHWPLQIHPYVKNLQIYTCPSDPDPRRNVGSNFNKPLPMSYGINERMYLGNVMGASMPAMPQAAVNFPADTYYISDTHVGFAQLFQGGTTNNPFGNSIFNRIRFHKDCGDQTTSGGGVGVRPNPSNPDACTRHQGGGNIAFADGHAKWYKWPSLDANKSIPTRATP